MDAAVSGQQRLVVVGDEEESAVFRILDGTDTKKQSNAMSFDRPEKGAFEINSIACKLRVLKGGDGGAFVFLSTAQYGARGPAPFQRITTIRLSRSLPWPTPNRARMPIFSSFFSPRISTFNPSASSSLIRAAKLSG